MKFDWDDYVQALHIYINEHGDCVVPQGYKVEMTGMNLGKWVQNQRQNRRNNKLSKERMDELNSLEFRWNCGTTSAPATTGKKKKGGKKATPKKTRKKRKKDDDDDDDDDDEPISKLKAKKSRAKSPAKKPPAKKRRTTKAKAKKGPAAAATFEAAADELMDMPGDGEGIEMKNETSENYGKEDEIVEI
jgi:Helicase associated domain